LTVAYLDTSALLAIVFGEAEASAVRRVLRGVDRVVSGDLLVAEALAAAARETMELASLAAPLEAVSLILPDRSLEPEMREVLEAGPLRGADLWHLACALFLAGAERSSLSFVSRDRTQRRVARELGFPTP